MEQSIDSFKRKIIRQACGFFWSNRMSTKKVNSPAKQASQIVARRRWQMLSHFLRMNDQVPAKRNTMECLASKNTKRGKPSKCFLTTIRRDLKSHKLTLNEAIELAQKRKRWKLKGSLLRHTNKKKIE